MAFKQEQYKQEKARIDKLNEAMKRDDQIDAFTKKFGLGYSDMNSRMLQMEEKEVKDEREWQLRKTEHERRKREIEDHWHDSTGQAMKALQDKIPKDKKGKNISRRQKEHYSGFSLQELEIVIKNNKYGSNSDLYNDVATDLELFNTLVKKGGEEGDRFEVLNRLAESCKKYIDSRSPISRQGKRRKAMIEQLYDQVRLEVNRFTEDITVAYTEIEKAEDLSQLPKELVEKATSGKFTLLSRCLQDEVKNVNLEKVREIEVQQTEEDAKNDEEWLKIAEALEVQETDENQSKTLSTRFLNALGWTKRTPKQVTNIDMAEQQSPVKVKLYHTIAAVGKIGGDKDLPDTARNMVDQLAGTIKDSKQYLSSGNYGKGTYTAARGLDYINAEDRKRMEVDEAASSHSWSFGKSLGSMQVTMTFNHNAKIIGSVQAKKLCNHFRVKYPRFYNYINMHEDNGGYKCSVLPLAASIILAFYGYNTVYVLSGFKSDVDSGKKDGEKAPIDYYVTFDRSALSIDVDSCMVRAKEGFRLA